MSIKTFLILLGVPLIALSCAISMISSASSAERFNYDSRGKRDPFVPLIGQGKAPGAVAFAEIVTIDDVKLEGIVARSTGGSAAIMNGELVKENYRAGEVMITKINKNSVQLTISGKEYTINLPEEGGKKSE